MSPNESQGAGKSAVCKRDNINDTYRTNKDQLNFRPLLDIWEIRNFSIYDAHYNVPGYDKPFDTSGHMSLQAPANEILGEFLKDDSELEGTDYIWEEYGTSK